MYFSKRELEKAFVLACCQCISLIHGDLVALLGQGSSVTWLAVDVLSLFALPSIPICSKNGGCSPIG